MINRKHLMVDLETLGSTPGCAILSMGAVEFFPATNTFGQEFYATVDLQSCIDAGLHVEGETFYWWLSQSQIAREALSVERYSIHETLASFIGYLYEPRDTLMWAHGPSFDLAVLASAYRAAEQEKPWNFRNERDTRTVLALADMTMPKIEGAHNALLDAKNQAHTVMQAIRKICL